MARAKRKAARKTGARAKSAVQQDAIALLKADHRQVEEWFEQFESTRSDARKQSLAQKVCQALKVHTQIEEEIFYPAAREALDEEDLLDEAVVEHATAKDLIAQILEMEPSAELYDAKVKVLGEYIEHHVQEEEGEMFKLVKKSDMDLDGIGAELEERKQELLEEEGVEE